MGCCISSSTENELRLSELTDCTSKPQSCQLAGHLIKDFIQDSSASIIMFEAFNNSEEFEYDFYNPKAHLKTPRIIT